MSLLLNVVFFLLLFLLLVLLFILLLWCSLREMNIRRRFNGSNICNLVLTTCFISYDELLKWIENLIISYAHMLIVQLNWPLTNACHQQKNPIIFFLLIVVVVVIASNRKFITHPAIVCLCSIITVRLPPKVNYVCLAHILRFVHCFHSLWYILTYT